MRTAWMAAAALLAVGGGCATSRSAPLPPAERATTPAPGTGGGGAAGEVLSPPVEEHQDVYQVPPDRRLDTNPADDLPGTGGSGRDERYGPTGDAPPPPSANPERDSPPRGMP